MLCSGKVPPPSHCRPNSHHDRDDIVGDAHLEFATESRAITFGLEGAASVSKISPPHPPPPPPLPRRAPHPPGRTGPASEPGERTLETSGGP